MTVGSPLVQNERGPGHLFYKYGGAFTEFNNGNGFVLGEGAVGGSWYPPGSNDLALAGDDGMVLLNSYCSDDADGNPGHVTCDWNIQWRDAAGVSSNALGATHDTADNA